MVDKVECGLAAIDAIKGLKVIWMNVGPSPDSLLKDEWLKITCHGTDGVDVADLVDAMHLYAEAFDVDMSFIKSMSVYITKEDPEHIDRPSLNRISHGAIQQELNEIAVSKRLKNLADSICKQPLEGITRKINTRTL